MSVIVSDTSPLRYLILFEAEAVLARLFDKVLIPPTVFAELIHPNAPAIVSRWALDLPPWVAVRKPATLDLSLNLDQGEIEHIIRAAAGITGAGRSVIVRIRRTALKIKRPAALAREEWPRRSA
jgi:predicted nucleic acid-binding protein